MESGIGSFPIHLFQRRQLRGNTLTFLFVGELFLSLHDLILQFSFYPYFNVAMVSPVTGVENNTSQRPLFRTINFLGGNSIDVLLGIVSDACSL